MIKKLRWKLTLIVLVLLSLVMCIVLGVIYGITRINLERSSMTALMSADSGPTIPGRPGKPSPNPTTPCFILEQGPWGQLIASGSSHYDLTDTAELEDILEAAQDTGKDSGILKDRSLRYLRTDSPLGERYIFTDISAELQTLSTLRLTCFGIGLLSLLILFGISVLISRWAVRPVAQAWEQQRQFVADASHELKTPLTVITTNAELLRSDEYTPEEKARFSDSILTMCQQMRGLVTQLLDQARIDTGSQPEELTCVDLSRLVSDAVLPFEPVYYESGRTLTSLIAPDITVTGNADRLRQVVEILLDNGCKYSTPGATVVLRLTRQGRHCQITVQSPGATMTEQECRDIFKRFYRGDTARSMNRSYGLGLSIAQGIVHQHKGKIHAQSQNNQNTFYVTLPM